MTRAHAQQICCQDTLIPMLNKQVARNVLIVLFCVFGTLEL